MAVEPSTLTQLHCIQLLSYANTVTAARTVEAWLRRLSAGGGDSAPHRFQVAVDGEQGDGEAGVDKVRDTLAVFRQYYFAAPRTPEKAAALCQRLRDILPPPEEEQRGETMIVLAHVESPYRTAAAEGVLAALSGGRLGLVSSGPLTPEVDLFLGDDPRWLVFLVEPGSHGEDMAGRVIYPLLRVLETCFHKILTQQREYERIRDPLEGFHRQLEVDLDQFMRDVEKVPAEEPLKGGRPPVGQHQEIFRGALKQVLRTTHAFGDLAKTMGRARQMLVWMEANHANLLTLLKQVGEGPGAVALASSRRQRAELALEQVRADLARCQPLLDLAQFMGNSHQIRLLTELSLTEGEEAVRRDDTARLLEVFVIYFTFMQFWAVAVSTHFLEPDKASWWAVFLWIAVPALVIGGGLWRLFPWLEGTVLPWFDRSERTPRRPPKGRGDS